MDYIDFLTRLFKKTGGKYFHLILDTIASKVFMSDGTTVESSIESVRNQAAAANYNANIAQNTADYASNKAQSALENVDTKLDRIGAAESLAGNGLYAENNKLNINTDIEDISGEINALKQLSMQNFAPNDEIWITESGEFTVPYDGIYEILLIGGGGGGVLVTHDKANSNSESYLRGGISGGYRTILRYLQKDQNIDVNIGAGGLATIIPNWSEAYYNSFGGETYFGEVSTVDAPTLAPDTKHFISGAAKFLNVSGAGFGGSIGGEDVKFFGGGGGISGPYNNINDYESYYFIDNGKQGAIRLRFFNPTKIPTTTINSSNS